METPVKPSRQISAPLLVSAMRFCAAGCGAIIVGGAAAAGTYAYMNGQAKGTYSTGINAAFDASLAACKELGIPVVKQSLSGADADIEGKLSGDTVTISLELVGDNLTEIVVRVGLWGNESASRRIHNAIGRRL